jgi:intracellular multiplication protein IcmV
MGLFRGIKRIIKPHVDVPRWVSYRTLANTGNSLFDFSKRLFKIKQPQRQETFAQAMQRLNLSEQDLQQRSRLFLTIARTFTLLAMIIFCYGFYVFLHSQVWESILLSIATGCLALGIAFRYHFWHFQIQQRTLGCSIKTWWTQGLIKGLKKK